MIRYNTGTLVLDTDLNIVDMTEGYTEYVPAGKETSFIDNVKTEDQHLIHEMIQTLADQSRTEVCFRLRKKSGGYNWVTAMCERVATDSSYNAKIFFQDISIIGNDENAEEIDFSTGLLSKKAIVDYAKEMCKDPNNKIDLCIIDIDNFKQINDSKGHAFGDRVLREVSEIIRSVVGNDGKAGRIGGDELLLVLLNVEDKTKLRDYLKPIRETVERLYKDKNGFPIVTVSIGSANFPLFVDNYEALFNLADGMLYRAKNRGKNRYVMYNPDIHGKIVEGVLKEENRVVQDTTPQDRMKLMLSAIDGFFGENKNSIDNILMETLAAFELDEGYIFRNNLSKSISGFRRTENTVLDDQNSVSRVVENDADIRYVTEPAFDKLFNSNGVMVVDSPEIQLAKTEEAKNVFSDKGIKHAFFYKMSSGDQLGYVVFYNTRDLSRKFPQQYVTDFTYLGKMIDIALNSR
ncbi:MAG: GGDEF domain-containing protein [Butyrivibrio sp.]|nr:GGDEF domain-containing protein [Butyrivibrio sp.]